MRITNTGEVGIEIKENGDSRIHLTSNYELQKHRGADIRLQMMNTREMEGSKLATSGTQRGFTTNHTQCKEFHSCLSRKMKFKAMMRKSFPS